MFKKIILLSLFLVTHILSAQKEYFFDYVAEYKIYDNEFGNSFTDDHCLRYDFINSKDSSYLLHAFVNEKTILLKLIMDNGKSYQSEMAYDDFFVTNIGFKCPKSRLKPNSFYESLKKYEFVLDDDVERNGVFFKSFTLKRLKKEKGKTIPDDHFVIDNTIGFDHPVLFPSEILYKKWKKGEHFPNGLIKEIYAYNNKNEKMVFFELINFSSIEKHISIDYSDCNN